MAGTVRATPVHSTGSNGRKRSGPGVGGGGMSGPSVDSPVVKQSPIVDVEVDADQPSPPSGDTDGPSDDALRAVIEKIRPAVQADGGDIAFRGIDEHGVVTVELSGACVSCPASTMTLKAGVERILKDRVPGVTSVINFGDDDETLVSL